MSRVLVVDDDPGIRIVVRDALVRTGHEVETAADGVEALTKFNDKPAQLVITDLSMAGADGKFVVNEIRRISKVPILVLTVRQDEREKVRLLDAGADDYVVKPFGVDELLARVRALLRRIQPDDPAAVHELGDIRVDLAAHRIARNGDEIRLTPTEFGILKTMLEKPGAVWTHQQLIAAVWGTNAGVTTDALRVHIGSLRRKLEIEPARPRWIRTEPWVGYRLVRDD